MRDGFVKAAAGTPKIRVADCEYNAGQIIALMEEAAAQGVKVLALPELCVTGYTCGDLFLQPTLLDGAERALARILEETRGLDMLTALGLPVRCQNKLYNCAAIIQKGAILALAPKTHIPNYGEFYEARWFASPSETLNGCEFELARLPVRMATHPLVECGTVPGLVIGVEICEDLWAPAPPSVRLAAEGATLILNLSASDEVAGKADYRRQLVTSQSGRLVCGYIYADAGEGESSTDLVFTGHNMIAENGTLLAEGRFSTGLTISEIDVQRLTYERQRMNTYASPPGDVYTFSDYCKFEREETALTRPVSPTPFIPADTGAREQRCEEILTIAALGLKKRLEHTNAACAVVGLSGGLDSTLAILIAAKAFDLLGRDRQGILAVTMPCFGTTRRTRSNAELLARELGAEFMEVNIGAAVERHFADIGQSMDDHSVTFENAQARERTQVLMDLANQRGGLVIGTGDLSELALGWATYNGDHMSMYAVNASIPKTLVRHLVAWEAQRRGGPIGEVLRDILDTPVSPELLPPKDGEIAQKTEDLVGPYELHDFFLYYAVRWGFPPRKVLRLAACAFGGRYDREALLKWLKNFYRRFFSQQFKRSCLPDGPKVGSVGLSPRGDWRMPSDAAAKLWLDELEELS
ncbi:MAG: NAD(+) synthase [Oscillospiraceae bacterium]|nr:NAD(+) synthase [Oscillospiraceae bacterium]